MSEAPAVTLKRFPLFNQGLRTIANNRVAMLYGGSGSSKSWVCFYAVMVRAIRYAGSRHLIARKCFNHAKGSLWFNTCPRLIEAAFPGLTVHQNKSDWYMELENGSQIWLGGLDDKERTEKILGTEWSTIWLNECSQIAWSSVEMIRTRLRFKPQKDMALRLIMDMNPPTTAHWSYRWLIAGKDPDSEEDMNTEGCGTLLMNPCDNPTLADEYMEALGRLSTKKRARFLYGEFQSEIEGALWRAEWIDGHRVTQTPDLVRICTAIDPSASSNKDSDECGIVSVGIDARGHLYVLRDDSAIMTPRAWAARAILAYTELDGDRIVAEVNNGGEMVETVIRSEDPAVPYKAVHASKGKATRAEPISALYEQGLVHHVGRFPDMEAELTTWVPGEGNSPNRLDALVWACTYLKPPKARLPQIRSFG